MEPIELWDTGTGRLVARLPGPVREGVRCQFLGNGRWVWTDGESQSTVLVFSAEDGRLLARLNHEISHQPTVIVTAVFASPMGRRVATIIKDQNQVLVRMWDTASWRAEPETMPLPALPTRFTGPEFLTDDVFVLFEVGLFGAHDGLTVCRYGRPEPIARIAGPWPKIRRAGELLHSGDGRVFDARTWQRLRPPTGRMYHPDLARFAPDGRFVSAFINDENVLIDTRTDKPLPAQESWGNLPGFGMVTSAIRDKGVRVWLLPPAARQDLPPDLLELWAQVAVRGEIGPDAAFVKWDESTWERKRQELAARPAPYPDFPFPGRVATDKLHWLRAEYDAAEPEAAKLRLAAQLLRRSEETGNRDEAVRWRGELAKFVRAPLPW